MSTQIDYARIVLLNRPSRELAQANPVLLAGEAVISDVGTQTPSLRIGDGVRPWSALPRFGAGAQLAAPVHITPGPDGTISLKVEGSTGNVATQIIGGVGNSALEVMGAAQADPGWYYATFHPLTDTIPAPGTSNGLNIGAGTNANDTALRVQNWDNSQQFLRIRGDGSGFLGPNEQNSLRWNTDGTFTLGGSAQLPRQALNQLTDVALTDLAADEFLRWSGTQWVNVAADTFALTEITAGTGLTGGTIGPPGGTIGLSDTGVLPGDYIRADLSVDAQGRITEAHNGSMPSLQELIDVGAMDPEPQDGEVLGWSGELHRWINTPAPAGTLEGLHDVELTDPTHGQVLAFDGNEEKWVNETIATSGASVTVNATAPADPEPGWLWWDSSSGQLFVWYDDGTTGQWVIANSGGGGGGGISDSLTVGNASSAASDVGRIDQITPGATFTIAPDPVSGANGVTLSTSFFAGGAGPMIFSPGAAMTALRLNTDGSGQFGPPTAGRNALVINGGWGTPALYISNNAEWLQMRSAVTGVQLAFWGQGTDWAVMDVANAAYGLSINTQNASRFIISATGEVKINSPAAGVALEVNGPNGNWASNIVNNQTSCYGLRVASGNSINNTCVSFNNAGGGSNFFHINGDGSGGFGPIGTLTWGGGGNFIISANSNQDYALVVNASTSGASPAMDVRGWGGSHGLTVAAGVNSSTNCALFRDQYGSGGATFLQIRGDGRIFMPTLQPAAGGFPIYWIGGDVVLQSSSARFKQNIRSMPRYRARELLAQLRTVSFNVKDGPADPTVTHYGLIAEEVAAAAPALAVYDAKGEPLSVDYNAVAMLLVPLMQEMLGMSEPEGVSYG